jgi:hypothetical protein
MRISLYLNAIPVYIFLEDKLHPQYSSCLKKDDAASDVLHDHKVPAKVRFLHLGLRFMEPSHHPSTGEFFVHLWAKIR